LHRHSRKCLPATLAYVCEDRVAGGDNEILVILERVVHSLSKTLDAKTRTGEPDHLVHLKADDMALKLMRVCPNS